MVLSPPGMMSASHFSSSAGVRTSANVHCEVVEASEGRRESVAWWRRARCSKKAPWSASTPTVMGVVDIEAYSRNFWIFVIYMANFLAARLVRHRTYMCTWCVRRGSQPR